MNPRTLGINTRSAAYIFGIAWFLPYCVYTLWAYGIFPMSNLVTSQSPDSTFGWLCRQVATYRVALTLLLQLTVGCLFIVGSRRVSWRTLGFRRTSAVWFLVAVGGLASSYMFSDLLQTVFQVPVHDSAHGAANGNPSPIHSIGHLSAVLFLLVPATAIIEEVAFRGALYGWLRMNIGVIAAVGVSALIFSLVHLRFVNPGGLLGMSATVQILAGGIALALLYEKSGSLWPSIYLHAVNNTIVALQVLLPR